MNAIDTLLKGMCTKTNEDAGDWVMNEFLSLCRHLLVPLCFSYY